MKQWLTVVAVMALVTASVVRAQGPGPGGPQGGRRGGMGPMNSILPPPVVEQLSLTDEQKTKLKALDAQFVKERDEMVEKEKAAGNDLAKMREDAAAAQQAGDRAKAQELRTKMRELTQPQQELRQKLVDKLRVSLDDEQRLKLDKSIQDMQQRRGGRGGPGGPGGGGTRGTGGGGAPPPTP